MRRPLENKAASFLFMNIILFTLGLLLIIGLAYYFYKKSYVYVNCVTSGPDDAKGQNFFDQEKVSINNKDYFHLYVEDDFLNIAGIYSGDRLIANKNYKTLHEGDIILFDDNKIRIFDKLLPNDIISCYYFYDVRHYVMYKKSQIKGVVTYFAVKHS